TQRLVAMQARTREVGESFTDYFLDKNRLCKAVGNTLDFESIKEEILKGLNCEQVSLPLLTKSHEDEYALLRRSERMIDFSKERELLARNGKQFYFNSNTLDLKRARLEQALPTLCQPVIRNVQSSTVSPNSSAHAAGDDSSARPRNQSSGSSDTVSTKVLSRS